MGDKPLKILIKKMRNICLHLPLSSYIFGGNCAKLQHSFAQLSNSAPTRMGRFQIHDNCGKIAKRQRKQSAFSGQLSAKIEAADTEDEATNCAGGRRVVDVYPSLVIAV